jgi:hypothetical protein
MSIYVALNVTNDEINKKNFSVQLLEQILKLK